MSDTTTPTKNESLPELPNTEYRGGNDVYGKEFPLYTADQMRAYAEAALTREAPTEGVEGWMPTASMIASAVWRDWMTFEQADRLGAELHAWLTAIKATPPAPQRQSAKEVAIVCDWKDADPFPRFIEAEVDGRSVSLEWRDREDGLRELIVPAHTQSDYPGCSGDPASCPENEGYGCCKPNPQRMAQGEDGQIRALVTAANAVLAANPADDGMWTLELAVRPFNATKPAECADGCPNKQVCDHCQHTTQPPHQDRGEVNLDQVDAALFCTPVTDDGDELAMPIDCMNMGTPEQLPLARTIMRAALTAALTEAKQQDTDWRAFPYSNAWCDGLAACLRECGEHEAARQIDDIKRFVSDAVEAKQQGPGEVLARGWFHALPEDDYEFHDDASGAGKHCPGCIRAMIVREAPKVEAKRQTGENNG